MYREAYTYVCMYTHTYIHTYNIKEYAHAFFLQKVQLYVKRYTGTVQKTTHTHTRMYVHTYACTHTHTPIHTYTHTHTHTATGAHLPSLTMYNSYILRVFLQPGVDVITERLYQLIRRGIVVIKGKESNCRWTRRREGGREGWWERR